ncbi:hypothetical protein QDY65_00165 [Pyrococcus kukulkanii]|uniref:hypothetical protein n=1 Tax=Pyrococcus kukulkanii TaxID=1609559 RepID=UPI0035638B8E
MIKVKDSVEVALELDEKSVYSHIAHESAEDIIRIISAIDAERARLRGIEVYYEDDWDELIRERIRKGKRHTAFDFYNPELLEVWEEKVKEAKRYIKLSKYLPMAILFFTIVTAIVTILILVPVVIVGLATLPLALYFHEMFKASADLRYQELVQFFIYELKGLIGKFSLDRNKYKFELYNRDYKGVKFIKGGKAVVE